MFKATLIIFFIAIMMATGVGAENEVSSIKVQAHKRKDSVDEIIKPNELKSTLDKIIEASLNNDFTYFFKGFAKGISPKAFDKVKQCFKRSISEETSSKIKSEIESLSWINIKKSATVVGEITKLFFFALKDCKQAHRNASDLISILTKALSGMMLVDAAIRFVTSPIKFSNTITTNIKRSMFKYKSNKYENKLIVVCCLEPPNDF